MMALLEIVGWGGLYLSGDGQGLTELARDPIAAAERPFNGVDTAHLTRYEGTDLCQWLGRRADGRFHPYGKILRLTAEGKRLIEGDGG